MANPAFGEKTFVGLESDNGVMTVEGAIQKSVLLIAVTILSALATWMYEPISIIVIPNYIWFAILGFIIALIIIFKKKTAPFLAPVYAIVEGTVIGAISMIYEAALPGVVMQAVGLTFIIFLVMLGLYASKIIVVTEKFRMGVVAATGAIMFMYLISIFGSLTGLFTLPFIHESGIIGIGISVFIVGIAAFNLALDFDMIEEGAKSKAPKYMEWYASFGLLVTLVWLYLEVLRLLGKMRK